MKHLILVVALYIVTVGVNSTFADDNYYDRCGQILLNGIIETFEYEQNIQQKEVLKAWLCWSASGNTSRNAAAELDILDLISFGGGGGDVDSWAEQYCRDNSYDFDGSQMTHLLIQKVNPDIVEAWKACVLSSPNSGIVCYAEESTNSMVVKVQSYHGIDDPTVQTINLNVVSDLPDFIFPGEFSILSEKPNPREEARFVLNGQVGYSNGTCSFYMPPRLTITRSECQYFRDDLYDAGILSYRDYNYFNWYDLVPVIQDGRIAAFTKCGDIYLPY